MQYQEWQRRQQQQHDYARQKIYEEILRQQMEYEERMKREWQNQQSHWFRMEEEILAERDRLMRKKFVAFFLMFTGFYLFFEAITNLWTAPSLGGGQYVYHDKVTGKRIVMSEQDLRNYENLAKQYQYGNNYNPEKALDDELKRIISQQKWERAQDIGSNPSGFGDPRTNSNTQPRSRYSDFSADRNNQQQR